MLSSIEKKIKSDFFTKFQDVIKTSYSYLESFRGAKKEVQINAHEIYSEISPATYKKLFSSPFLVNPNTLRGKKQMNAMLCALYKKISDIFKAEDKKLSNMLNSLDNLITKKNDTNI